MAAIDDKQALCGGIDGRSVAIGSRQPPPHSPPPPYQEPLSRSPNSGARQNGYDRQPPQTAVMQFQQCHQPQALPYDPNEVTVEPLNEFETTERTMTFAVVMCVTICGLLGMHHFYLNRTMMGTMYAITCGIFGIGWVVDWFRIPALVRKCNAEIWEAKERGHFLTSKRYGRLTMRSVVDAYLMWLPPLGWFGAHHYYTGRRHYSFFHAVTFGLHVVGWVVDLFRIPHLVRKANQDIRKLKTGSPLEEPRYSLLDAYLLSIPLGVLGLHHFYLGNTKRGVLFLCTLGIFGLGWLADIFQMPFIVAEANKRRQMQQRLAAALNQQQHCTTATTVVVVKSPEIQYQQHSGHNAPEPPPAYMPQPAVCAAVETVHPPPPQVAATHPTTNHPASSLRESSMDESNTTSSEGKKMDFIDYYCR